MNFKTKWCFILVGNLMLKVNLTMQVGYCVSSVIAVVLGILALSKQLGDFSAA